MLNRSKKNRANIAEMNQWKNKKWVKFMKIFCQDKGIGTSLNLYQKHK